MASFEKRGKKWRAVVSYVNGHGVFKKVTSTFETQREASCGLLRKKLRSKTDMIQKNQKRPLAIIILNG